MKKAKHNTQHITEPFYCFQKLLFHFVFLSNPCAKRICSFQFYLLLSGAFVVGVGGGVGFPVQHRIGFSFISCELNFNIGVRFYAHACMTCVNTLGFSH